MHGLLRQQLYDRWLGLVLAAHTTLLLSSHRAMALCLHAMVTRSPSLGQSFVVYAITELIVPSLSTSHRTIALSKRVGLAKMWPTMLSSPPAAD
jgi:hypothetical protein